METPGTDYEKMLKAGEVKELDNMHQTMTMDNIFDIAEQATLEVYRQRDVIRALKYEQMGNVVDSLIASEINMFQFEEDEEIRGDFEEEFNALWDEIRMLSKGRSERVKEYASDIDHMTQAGEGKFLIGRNLRMIGRLEVEDMRQKRIEIAQRHELREFLTRLIEEDFFSDMSAFEQMVRKIDETEEDFAQIDETVFVEGFLNKLDEIDQELKQGEE